jgi:hypothetical protein
VWPLSEVIEWKCWFWLTIKWKWALIFPIFMKLKRCIGIMIYIRIPKYPHPKQEDVQIHDPVFQISFLSTRILQQKLLSVDWARRPPVLPQLLCLSFYFSVLLCLWPAVNSWNIVKGKVVLQNANLSIQGISIYSPCLEWFSIDLIQKLPLLLKTSKRQILSRI